METPEPCSPLAELEFLSFDEVRCLISTFEYPINYKPWLFCLACQIFSQALASTSLDEVLPDASGSHSGRRTSMSSNSQDILSVNQLLESVSSVPLVQWLQLTIIAVKVIISVETFSFPSVSLRLGQTHVSISSTQHGLRVESCHFLKIILVWNEGSSVHTQVTVLVTTECTLSATRILVT